ncbi:MAG: response regulator [Desulfobacterales bacterium]
MDDIESQREITSMMLDMLGYQSVSVPSGEEAVEYLKRHAVDIVLLDMIMLEPGINGYRDLPADHKIHPGKAIILSGFYGETKDVKKAQSLGAGNILKADNNREIGGELRKR